MSLHKLPRGLLEIPKGTKTNCNDNSSFSNSLERTNTLLAQFVSATNTGKKLIMRQELEESYFNLTMYNLKESVKHKIEQDMWNNLFKKYISDLQIKIKSKDKSESSKAQCEMSIFLDESVGFYSKCLDTLSLIYDIRLPGGENRHKVPMKKNRNVEATEDDLRYIVQHCYVHMGDLSRYHNLSKQAKFYYELAVQINPSSGHAYNQLAILESSSVAHSSISSSNYQQIIRTILMYEYANTCKIPFPATRINLESLLRHINDQSVSTLLTSNNTISDQNCIHSISIAWIHAYANLRMLHNIQRCRQLQQRIVDWAGDLAKHNEVCKSDWRVLTSMMALHCSLLSSYNNQTDFSENKLWTSNMNQFSQDLINALCRGVASFAHDSKIMEELLSNTGCVSMIIVYLMWIHQSILSTLSSGDNGKTQCPLKYPFGEDFVKFVNILLNHNNNLSNDEEIKMPSQLMEVDFVTGFQPLKVPCKIYRIYSDQLLEEKVDSINESPKDVRVGFIVSVCKLLVVKCNGLLAYNTADERFVTVPAPEPPVKKHVKIEPSVMVRKPVNVALASMKINNIKSNGFVGQNIPSKVSAEDDVSSEQSKGIITDVKIAKCIKEHIAQDSTKTSANCMPLVVGLGDSSPSVITAPAPGLILSSNLPPEYKSMSSSTSTSDQPHTSSSRKSSLIASDQTSLGDQLSDYPSSKISSVLAGTVTNKNHSYNPNREQFEKDLPPRFANKRSFTQESALPASSTIEPIRNFFDQNNGGFASMNYWDSINDFPTNQPLNNQFDNNLTKKESELLLPPTVPSSWLTDDGHENLIKLDSNISNAPSMQQQYPFGNNLIHSHQQQPSHSFSTLSNNQSSQNHLSMMQQSFNQFKQQNHQPVLNESDSSNQLQFLLQSVTTNANSPRFRSQTDGLFSAQMGYDNSMFLQHQNNVRMPAKFHSMAAPTQQHQQSINSHLSQQISNTNQNYDSFQLTRPNFFDKPIFSTSTQSAAAFPYSSSGSIMTQHQQPMAPLPQHQVRHNNPLLNLLPGFMNEAQR